MATQTGTTDGDNMDYTLVDTEIDAAIDLMVVKAFCFGLSDKRIKILNSPDTGKYVLAFEDGEDALHFKLNELDKKLIEMYEDHTSRSIDKNMFVFPNPNTMPGMAPSHISPIWGGINHSGGYTTSTDCNSIIGNMSVLADVPENKYFNPNTV